MIINVGSVQAQGETVKMTYIFSLYCKQSPEISPVGTRDRSPDAERNPAKNITLYLLEIS